MSEFTPIDIKALAAKVSPKLAKLPRFIFRYLERILHVKEINTFLGAHFQDDSQTFLDALKDFLDIKVEFSGRGLDGLKEMEGRQAIFASNHPYGGPEALMLLQILHGLFPDVKLVAQSFLKFIEPMTSTCVYNKKDVRTLVAALEAKNPIQVYPAAFCSRKLTNGEVFDYGWKPGFIKLARKYGMPIVVIYADGSMSRRMHRWTAIRKFLHIKMNFETLFLVDEMFKLRGKTLKMVVGDTITPEQLDPALSNDEWADRLRQYCYDLRRNPGLAFDPAKPATLTKV